MGKYRLFVITAAFLCGSILHGGEAGLPGIKKKSWSYTPISINSTTSDDSKFKADLRVERISRKELGLVGNIMLNYDMSEKTTTMEGLAFRSTTGKDWKVLPFVIRKQGLTEFMNGFYKQMLMSSLNGCTNYPRFEIFEPPLVKQTYEFNKCVINIDNMPDHMQEGYYKVQIIGHGEVEWVLEIIIKIDKQDD